MQADESGRDACLKLRQVTLPRGLKTLPAYIFTNCDGLKTVEIPASVTEIGYGAFFASGITEITVPEGVTAIGENAFYSCKALTKATLSGTISGTLTNVFDSCDQLTDVYFGGSPEAWQALQANLLSQTKVHFKKA
ncbi:MAG: leucine-rich repeat domain-containing protein [Clostridia bacterium]|nr:leucine-rich repeat domain-containing protein [Clostridia bacterium]